MLIIRKIDNIDTYTNFLKKIEKNHFMQTFQWAEFKARFGWQNVGQYLIENDSEPLAAFSILKRSKFGINILYVPRGPLFSRKSPDLIKFTLAELKKIARRERAFFVRISPAYEESDAEIKQLLVSSGFNLSKKQLQTKATIMIDLSKDEDTLLNSFHSKTRYNIRLAEKKAIQVAMLSDNDQLDEFYQVLEKMSVRQNYNLQSKEYYQYIKDKLVVEGLAAIYLAIYDSKVIGGVVVFYAADTAYYMYGGFDYEYRNLMGNYLVHWQIIRDSKNRGLKNYDMQGVPLVKDENHPMYGFYRFKKGFNGQELEFIGEYDYSRFSILYGLWNNIGYDKSLYLQ